MSKLREFVLTMLAAWAMIAFVVGVIYAVHKL